MRTASALARELDAGLVALRAAYGPYVDEGPVVYAGFSLGAYPRRIDCAENAKRIFSRGSRRRWL